jgi:multicomponent Na+:H+ antiporter subunit A
VPTMADLLGTLLAPSPLLVLLTALAGAPVTAVIGWRRPRLAAIVAVIFALLSLWLVGARTVAGESTTILEWAPTLGFRLGLTFDGVSAIYGQLATGIGAVVLAYSAAYIPRHLHHHDRNPNDATAFYALILLFMGAMIGLVVADDLFLLFMFWDLTAVVSYFLIGFDRNEPLARPAALMALLVTGGSAILMLAGIVILWIAHGTSSIAMLIDATPGGVEFSLAIALICVSALAKSAQVPLHFWLPRAMVAPTPVSSYLHSAAMVAAGVFLIARLLPLMQRAAWIPQALVFVGICSIAIGGLLAISRDDMKRVLAYSTIGQYGYVVVLLGLGGEYGAVGAAFYVIAHGLAKCALFLTAGAVTESTGRKTLSGSGGLWRQMPVVAVASGIAAATIAALPLSIGFFKDELFFAAMHGQGIVMTALAVLSAALTFGYIGRFWGRLFLGRSDAVARPIPIIMPAAIGLLAALCLVGGVWAGPFNALANAGGADSLRQPVDVALNYHLDARPENVMALTAYLLGLGIIVSLAWWTRVSEHLASFAKQFGPERIYRGVLDATNAASDRLYGYEVHDLRGRVAWVLLPVGVLVLLGLIFTSNENAYLVGEFDFDDLLIVLVLGVACVAALTATQVVGHLSAAILLSAVGFPLAAIYAFLGAPDVALVAVLMETMMSLLFIGFLAAMRDRPRIEGFEHDPALAHRGRDRFIGFAAAAASFVIVWGVLSKPAATETAARDQIALTPAAHASDVVTAILSDFRGLDTMGEITVIGITMIGLWTLLQRPVRRRLRA